ncbi:MAG TPA: hypothetical protein VNL71_14560 [Chloroflexota bacterium]|nr:hypothetical protein [Chloroflexota bacterium]
MPTVSAPPISLPPSFRRLFWEYDFSQITWHTHATLILQRILGQGTWVDVCWLRDTIGTREIRRFLMRTRGKGIDRRFLRYWEATLNLPHEVVTGWIRDPGRQIWDGR